MKQKKDKKINNKNSPIALIILSIAIIFFQSGSAFATTAFATIGPMATVALRQGASALLLGVFAQIWLIDYKNLNYKALVPYGISLGVMNIAFYLSIERIPLGVAVSIEFIGPLLVSIFSSRKLIDFLWIALAAVGIFILLPVHEFSAQLDGLGLLYAAIAAAAWGAYIYYGHKIGKSMNAMHSVALGLIICTLISLPIALVVGVKSNIAMFEWVKYAIILTLLSGAVPYAMEMFAMRRMERKTIGLLMSLDPAFAVLSGFVFLHQKLNLMQSLAVLLIMVASLGATMIAPKAKEDAPLLDG